MKGVCALFFVGSTGHLKRTRRDARMQRAQMNVRAGAKAYLQSRTIGQPDRRQALPAWRRQTLSGPHCLRRSRCKPCSIDNAIAIAITIAILFFM